MGRCGRCRGRTVIKSPTGLAMVPCPDCQRGVKTARSSFGVPEEYQRAAKLDERNVVAVCDSCHQKIHAERIHLAPHELHPDFWSFIVEFDLEGAIPRYMACGAAASLVRQGTSTAVQPSREEAA